MSQHVDSRSSSQRQRSSSKIPTEDKTPSQSRKAPSAKVTQHRYSASTISEEVADNNLASWNAPDNGGVVSYHRASARIPGPDDRVTQERVSEFRLVPEDSRVVDFPAQGRPIIVTEDSRHSSQHSQNAPSVRDFAESRHSSRSSQRSDGSKHTSSKLRGGGDATSNRKLATVQEDHERAHPLNVTSVRDSAESRHSSRSSQKTDSKSHTSSRSRDHGDSASIRKLATVQEDHERAVSHHEKEHISEHARNAPAVHFAETRGSSRSESKHSSRSSQKTDSKSHASSKSRDRDDATNNQKLATVQEAHERAASHHEKEHTSEHRASKRPSNHKSSKLREANERAVNHHEKEHVDSRELSLHRQASDKIPSDNNPQPQKAVTFRAEEKELAPSPSHEKAKSHRRRHHGSSNIRVHAREVADDEKKSKRLDDDEHVPGLVWFFAGGTGMPPTGKQLRDKKGREEEYVARRRGEEVEDKEPRRVTREERRGVPEEVVGSVEGGQNTSLERRRMEDYEKEKLREIVERKLSRSGDW